jgi:hypothetical protein
MVIQSVLAADIIATHKAARQFDYGWKKTTLCLHLAQIVSLWLTETNF